MKKIVIVALGCLLVSSVAFAGDPSPADQKWLTVVEKMIADGQTKVSTPSKERVALVEKWAEKNGYSVAVTKVDVGYKLEFSKRLAKK